MSHRFIYFFFQWPTPERSSRRPWSGRTRNGPQATEPRRDPRKKKQPPVRPHLLRIRKRRLHALRLPNPGQLDVDGLRLHALETPREATNRQTPGRLANPPPLVTVGTTHLRRPPRRTARGENKRRKRARGHRIADLCVERLGGGRRVFTSGENVRGFRSCFHANE